MCLNTGTYANVDSVDTAAEHLTAAMLYRIAARGAALVGSSHECSHVQSHLNRAKNQDVQDSARRNLPTRHSSELLDNWPRWSTPIMKIDSIKKTFNKPA
jgi:hypothetical protein